MGFLNFFPKPAPTLMRLPSGSFTVDRHGDLITRTLPSSFPADLLHDLAAQILATFKDAAAAQLPLAELIIYYSSLKITARELRGGAIVFLAPRTAAGPVNLP